MNNWRRAPLGTLFELCREPLEIDPTSSYVAIGIKSFGKGIFRYPPTIGAELSKIRWFRFPPDALLASNIQAWEGALGVSTGLDARECIASNRFLPYLPRDRDQVIPEFVLAYLLSDRGRAEVRQSSPGTAVRNKTLSRHLFEAIEIPLPPIDEQRRIATSLARADEHIDALTHATAKRTRAESASALRSRISAMFEHCTARTTVAELAGVVNELVRPGDDPGDAKVFVGLEHIAGDFGKNHGSRPVGAESGRKFRFTEGDVLYGYLRPYQNKVWLADRVGLCSVEQLVLRTKSRDDAELLWFALRGEAVLDRFVELTNNLQLPRLRSGDLLATTLNWPAPGERSRVLADLRRVQAVCSDLSARIAEQDGRLAAIGPAMLNEVFNGSV